MIFRWLVERRGSKTMWTARGAVGTRDEPCMQCAVPKQAHTRERHAFIGMLDGRKK